MPNILIVDDSSFARASLRRSLQEAGYNITEAASGGKAVEIAPEVKPDLVTLDLLMPGLSGLETLQLMLPLCPGARFIIISADVQTTTRAELMEAGAHEFLNKPVAKEDLLAAVKRQLAASA